MNKDTKPSFSPWPSVSPSASLSVSPSAAFDSEDGIDTLVRLSDIVWLPAKGNKLKDHKVGELCKDSSGRIFLIGHCEEGSNIDGGSHDYSRQYTIHDIVEYCKIIDFEA